MDKENSAVELLLDRINDLMRRIELLEERVLHPTYTFTNTIHAPSRFVPENSMPQDEVVQIPTVRATATDIYWPSIVDRYERRLNDLERQLHERMDEANQYRFEMWDDGQIYINAIWDEWVNP